MRSSILILLPGIGLALALAMALAPTSQAQISKAMSAIYDIRSLKEQISPEKKEAELKELANKLRIACETIGERISACGVELATSAGPHQDARKKFRDKVEEVALEAGKLQESAVALFERTSSDKCSDLKLQANYFLSRWDGLSEVINQTRKFLKQGWDTTNALRTDLGTYGDILEKQTQETHRKEKECGEKVKALQLKWFDLTAKRSTAFVKQREAYQRWYDFVKGGGDPQGTKGVELSQQWHSCVLELEEAESKANEAIDDLDDAQKEMEKFFEERAKSLANLEKFIQDLADKDPTEAWNEFDAWLKSFEKDVSG